MKLCAVGDIIIGRRIQEDFAGYAELSPIINQADARTLSGQMCAGNRPRASQKAFKRFYRRSYDKTIVMTTGRAGGLHKPP